MNIWRTASASSHLPATFSSNKRCVSSGATQPDPVVNPGSPHSRMCTIAGRSPMPLMT